MPLQNRVDPSGELFADASRGLLMGNRGGKFHRDDRTLSARRQVSRQWICCVLQFKGRQRSVWGRYYTELFFLDEATAFAAGHRPCFECRRADALAFAERFSGSERPSAPDMDRVLHGERLDGRSKRLHRVALDDLPDGAFVRLEDGDAAAVRGARLLRWSSQGYREALKRPRAAMVDMLTPPSMARVLARGYRPLWHPCAEQW